MAETKNPRTSGAASTPRPKRTIKTDRNRLAGRVNSAAEVTGSATRGYSAPVFEQKLTLRSVQAQRVVERALVSATYSLFQIGVILRIIGDEKTIDQMSDLIDEKLDTASKELSADIAAMEELRRQYAIVDNPAYTKPMIVDVKITSPQAGRYVGLIRQMDTFIGLVDSLWLSGQLTGGQRTTAMFKWQQALIRLGRDFSDLSRRAMESANARGKAEDVKSAIHEELGDGVNEVEERVAQEAAHADGDGKGVAAAA